MTDHPFKKIRPGSREKRMLLRDGGSVGGCEGNTGTGSVSNDSFEGNDADDLKKEIEKLQHERKASNESTGRALDELRLQLEIALNEKQCVVWFEQWKKKQPLLPDKLPNGFILKVENVKTQPGAQRIGNFAVTISFNRKGLMEYVTFLPSPELAIGGSNGGWERDEDDHKDPNVPIRLINLEPGAFSIFKEKGFMAALDDDETVKNWIFDIDAEFNKN